MNYLGDFHVRIQRSFAQHDHCNLWLINYVNGRKSMIAKPIMLEWQKFDDVCPLPQASMNLPCNLLKALGHGLIESGDLPKDFLANDREMTATRSHLDDMRKLLFNELGVQK